MACEEIKKGIYWVGAIDWDIRNFHGYLTQNGTSYNAYLVVDEKITLIDTVKKEHSGQMLDRIRQVVDPTKIDYILSNHVEMDHSGALPEMMALAPAAVILASKQGEKGLRRHFKADWNIQVVKTGDSISIGTRTLTFTNTAMVHWPDSMMTYIPEEKLLFSNDAFGQHMATAERLDREVGWSLIRRDAAKYYANIVLPYGKQVGKLAEAISDVEIEMICPSHGLIWQAFVPDIIAEYGKWSVQQAKDKALIIYDTMWQSTEKIARSLEAGLSDAGLRTTMRNMKACHISDVMTDIMESRLILLGSPTLNGGMLPTMAAMVSYMQGLKPQNKVGFAFGSYGWRDQAVPQLEAAMDEMKWVRPLDAIQIEYVPDSSELTKFKDVAEKLAAYLSSNPV